MTHTFRPSVTVAAIIERDDGRFLLIEEETSDGIKLNQPAGHLDPNESLEQAVVREALEESALEFIPTGLVGMYMSRYHSKSRGTDITYLRFTFCGKPGKEYDQPLDHGILRTMWMTRDEIAACQERHRSPIVLKCVDDYLAGKRTSLDLLYTDTSVFHGGLAIQPDVT
ncbi:NUDIX hydrolase [Massilia norwichensis]|jgi:8-oxo-dGTP pyrophosphatase MutT (NUDIX family)|uniref:Phosphatase NudJ n=1 Tax=Massilia norwichensis TaxID=1442366 RepID=A0ABT2ADD9_9BURK|nr:NUDIX hydrolase [Massilia norwichensis]MCS0592162.1 NUDIX hydrolase [Massilia norwichensis]